MIWVFFIGLVLGIGIGTVGVLILINRATSR
jgi:hypothetical protein